MKVVVPGRNQLIVDTYLEYVKNKSTVVFCTSVDHAKKMEAAFQEKGIAARSISGSTKTSERRKILHDYENGTIKVLCACDLLNEGWDSPHTRLPNHRNPDTDICAAIQINGLSDEATVRTVWLNRRDDTHDTIHEENYVRKI